MAKGTSSSSPVPLFIDTNLDTHLAMLASLNDTVAELKGKIRTEHALCFPKFGEVAIQALKVKRRASFYHLSDSMLVKFAFSGIKGSWFLHLDVEPTTSIVKSPTETTEVIMENNRQPDEQNVLQANGNVSILVVTGEDRNQEIVANGITVEDDHESETLGDSTFQKPSAQGDSLLPNVSSPRKQSLHVFSHELDERPDPGVPEMELVTESDAVVGSNHQKIRGQVANHGVEADMDVPVVDSMKENSRKRSSALQKDQLLDDKSEHHYVEKKKRKKEKKKEKEKDPPFNKGVEDHNSGHNLESGLCSKGTSQLEEVLSENGQEKHETTLMPSEVYPSKPSDVEFLLQQTPTDDTQKKKKCLSTNDEPPRDEVVDNSLSKPHAVLGRQPAVENHVKQLVKDHNDLGNQSDAADLIEESAQKELDGGSKGVGNVDPLSTNLQLSTYNTERLSKSTETRTEEVSNVDSDGPLLMNTLAQGKTSSATNICKEAENPSNLAEVVPEVPAISQHGSKRSKNEKDVSSKHDVVDSLVKAADKEDIDETSGKRNDKLSKASGVALNDADISNKIALESGIPSEVTVKCSQHTGKKKGKKSELRNGQPNTHETANSSVDQVPEENQHKMSSTSEEPLGKKLKGTAFPEAVAAGNSAVAESIFPSNPSDKKKKRRQKKSEKIETHHEESKVQSSTYETLNPSRDQVVGELSKETSIRDLEDLGNESKQAAVLGDVGNSTAVSSNPNEKKSKSKRKKSEKIELPSGESIRAESVHFLAEKDTEGNPRGSLEDNQDETAGSRLGHAGKGSEEAAVLSNPSTVQSIVPPSPSDKKSKRSKKSGKTELPRKGSSMDEAIHPLVKVATEENPEVTFDGITTGIGENSKLATTFREATGIENTSELDSAIISSANGRNSCHKGKTIDRPPVIGHLSSSYDLDRSLASDPTQENLEKMSGTAGKYSDRESNVRVSSDETEQNMGHVDPCNLDSTGFNDSSDKNETGHLSAEKAAELIMTGLQMSPEELDMKKGQETIHKGSADLIEAKDHGELSKSDGGKLDVFKFSDPEASKLLLSSELLSLETETKKTGKEKSKRKKKLNPSPQDSTANLLKPSVSEKQCTIPKKPQDSDSGTHSLSDPAVLIAKEELLSSKKHKKKDANNAHKSDVNVLDRSCDVGSPWRSDNVVKPGKQRQNYESSMHSQASLSSVDDGSRHPNGKNSMRTGSKLQSLALNESNDFMISESEVQQPKNFNSYVGSQPGRTFTTQNSSNAATNVPVGEDTDDLVASSDSTEEDTPVIQKRYRVAVRKVPKNRSSKVPHKFNMEKTTLAPSATIFNDASSGSSDDGFEISNRKAPVKSSSDNSSSSDSYEGIEETQTSYRHSPGAESLDNRKVELKNNGARGSLTKSPNVKRKGKSLGMILKSTSSYKKARISASASEMEDSESQQIDLVPETQPELGSL